MVSVFQPRLVTLCGTEIDGDQRPGRSRLALPSGGLCPDRQPCDSSFQPFSLPRESSRPVFCWWRLLSCAREVTQGSRITFCTGCTGAPFFLRCTSTKVRCTQIFIKAILTSKWLTNNLVNTKFLFEARFYKKGNLLKKWWCLKCFTELIFKLKNISR